MPIVIHDFEIVPREDRAAASSRSPKPPAPEKSRGLSLIEVTRVQRHAHERSLRLWAH